jgi:hypothetical protein
MHLVHYGTKRNTNGLFEISIAIVKEFDNIRNYVYKLNSEFGVRQFEYYYRRGKGFAGVALRTLNEFKVKEKEI